MTNWGTVARRHRARWRTTWLTQPKVIANILAHLAAKGADGRSPPGASRNQRPAA